MELEVALSKGQPGNSSLILHTYGITPLHDQQAAIFMAIFPLDQEIRNSSYSVSNAPSAKAAKKMKDSQESNTENVTETTARALEKISVCKEKMQETQMREDTYFA